jgi:hypothetical protein
LRHVEGAPGELDGVLPLRVEPLDGDDLVAFGVGDRGGAGADRDPVEVDGAGAAEPLAASELRSGEPELLADRPEQRRRGIELELVELSVDLEADDGPLPAQARNI